MRAFRRYVLLQVPGWALAACLVVWLWPRTGLDPWLGALVLAAWVAKDFALWPVLRVGYDPDVPTGAAELVGRVGVVQQPLSPKGWVRIRGELWRAELDGPGETPAGTKVEVIGASRMTLRVRPR